MSRQNWVEMELRVMKLRDLGQSVPSVALPIAFESVIARPRVEKGGQSAG